MHLSSVEELDQILRNYKVTVVLFVTAEFPEKNRLSWYVEEVLDEIADPRTNERVVEIETFPKLAQRFAITQTPTIIVFKFGEEVKRYTIKPWKKKIIEVIRSHLGPFDISTLLNPPSQWN